MPIGLQKAFIASDPDLLKFGVTKKVTDLLDQNKLAYEVYGLISSLTFFMLPLCSHLQSIAIAILNQNC